MPYTAQIYIYRTDENEPIRPLFTKDIVESGENKRIFPEDERKYADIIIEDLEAYLKNQCKDEGEKRLPNTLLDLAKYRNI